MAPEFRRRGPPQNRHWSPGNGPHPHELLDTGVDRRSRDTRSSACFGRGHHYPPGHQSGPAHSRLLNPLQVAQNRVQSPDLGLKFPRRSGSYIQLRTFSRRGQIEQQL